jgi:Fe2+ transport system protein FeoA
MARELERGEACIVIGVAHCPGVLARLKELGYVNLPCP